MLCSWNLCDTDRMCATNFKSRSRTDIVWIRMQIARLGRESSIIYLSVLLDKWEWEWEEERETETKKITNNLAVKNSVAGNRGSGKEITAYNNLEISNELGERWCGQRVPIMNTKWDRINKQLRICYALTPCAFVHFYECLFFCMCVFIWYGCTF